MLDVTVKTASYGDADAVLELLYELGRPKPSNDDDDHDLDEFKKNDTKIHHRFRQEYSCSQDR